MLCPTRVVRDAGAGNSKGPVGAGGDGIGIRGGRSERYAVDLRIRRCEDIGRVRKRERRNIAWSIGNSHWRPVGSRIPVARTGIKIPLCTVRVGDGWNEEHERA